MTQNGVINTTTGNLLRSGSGVDFENDSSFNGGSETYKTDVPFPNKIEGDSDETMVTHWTGSVWDEVSQP